MKRLFALIFLVFISAAAFAVQGGKPFWRNIPALEYNGHNRNFDILCGDDGLVYVANFEGLIVWDGIQWRMLHTPGISRITCLYKAADGKIWVGGHDVIGVLEDDGGIRYVASDTLSTLSFGDVYSMTENNGMIVFNTEDSRYLVNHDKIVFVSNLEDEDISYLTETWHGKEVNCIVPIGDRSLRAIATKTDGLFVVDEDDMIRFRLSTDDGLCSDDIEWVSYDGKGSVWGATNNGIFQLVLSPVFSKYEAADGLVGQVTSIENSFGTLYAGTLQGLFYLGKDDRFHKVQGIDLACWKVVPFGRGVLAATAQGLFRYDGHLERLSPRHTLSIYVSTEGNIISGEVDGIYLINGEGEDVKLSDTKYVAAFKRAEDGLWAINYYGETFFVSVGSTEFRPQHSDSLSLLMHYTDPHGRRWSSGPGGMGVECPQLEAGQALWCRGLDAFNVETMNLFGDDAYFGGNFGIIRMDMKEASEVKPYSPALQVRSMNVDKHTASFAVCLDKTDPMGEPRYSYRLHPDSEWSAWKESGDMNFGHMDIGKYELSVRCMDSFGEISVSSPTSFAIEAPFYLKWYAFLVYFFISASAVKLYFHFKFKKERREKERLEALVMERTQELKDAQGQLLRQEREATVGKLTKGLIDRILNPMNYINNFSHLSIGLASDLSEDILDEKERMSEDSYDDCIDVCEMLKTNLGKIEQHGLATTRILKAMEELLKERSGKVETVDMVAICNKDYEMLANYYKDDIASLGIDIQWTAPEGSVTAQANAENISKTIMSLFSNSIYAIKKKFSSSSPGGQRAVIKLSLSPGPDGKGCRVEVFDNGTGIQEGIIDKVFDPFFTTKPTGEAPGVGLYLSQQIIQDCGGTISVDSQKDEYTKFTIELS